MVEYIQSNDDASNMSLYAGIAGVAFAGGAALAYRATSPIYKKGAKGMKGADAKVAQAVADTKINVPGASNYAKGAKDVALGSLASVVGGGADRRSKGIAEMVGSVQNEYAQQVGGVVNDVMYGKGSQKIYEDGMKNIRGDLDIVNGIITKDGGSAADIHKQLLEQRPNTLVSQSDVEKRITRTQRAIDNRVADSMKITDEMGQGYMDMVNSPDYKRAKAQEKYEQHLANSETQRAIKRNEEIQRRQMASREAAEARRIAQAQADIPMSQVAASVDTPNAKPSYKEELRKKQILRNNGGHKLARPKSKLGALGKLLR